MIDKLDPVLPRISIATYKAQGLDAYQEAQAKACFGTVPKEKKDVGNPGVQRT